MSKVARKVFISYNRADCEWAEWIAAVVEQAGDQPIIQAWDFHPGDNFVLCMDKAAAEADLTIAVLSESYLKAEYTHPEWAAAFAKDPTGSKRALIPVRIGECTPTGLLSQVIYIDLVSLNERAARQALLDELKPSSKHRKTVPFPDTWKATPFPPDLTQKPMGGAKGPATSRSNRRAERRCRERVIAEHASISILGRSKPIDLQELYIALRVVNYVAPDQRPDEPSRRTSEIETLDSGVVDAVEVVKQKPHRLVVLGDPGSGKTTFLKYLALRIAQRAPEFGEWAREIITSGPAIAADRVMRRLVRLGEQTSIPCFCFSIFALLLWVVGGFLSSSKMWATWSPRLVIKYDVFIAFGAVITVGLVTAYVLIRLRNTRFAVRISTAVAILVLVVSASFALEPWYAITAMGIAFIENLYHYWSVWPMAWLRKLRNRMTRYPLPLYLTLNDVGCSHEPLEVHLARTLNEAGFQDAIELLRRKLHNGTCLVLLDALDEVMDESEYGRIANEIAAFARRYERVPIIVTCRTAGFRDSRVLLPGFRRVEVQEFTEKEVKHFIRSWFEEPLAPASDHTEALQQSLGRNARMRELARNPLLLSLMCFYYEMDLRLPDRRVELYQRCADELIEKIDRDRGLVGQAQFSPDNKRRTLRAIARRFHEDGVRVFGEKSMLRSIEQVLQDFGYPATRSEALLRELMVRSGLIRQQSRSSYGFAHLTWQEFFTAENFCCQNGAMALFTHVGDPWWREVILLYLGLHQDATDMLRRLTEHDVLLSGTALADIIDPGTPAFDTLRGEIVERLKMLVDTDAVRYQEAADALAAIGRWGATEYLFERARTLGQPDVSLAAILALDQAGDRDALARLCERMGPVLQLLNAHLGKVSGAVDARILAVLDRLGFPLAYVPPGEFVMGNDTGDSLERPQHCLTLEGYWIGKYLVTNALYRRFLAETGSSSAGSGPKDDHPVVYVTWINALAFCRWAGVQLPSEAEWEKAARGTNGRRYPWGDDWETGWCNVASRGVSPVGTYTGDKSPYGCFDMAGNVKEWTRSLNRPYPYTSTDGRESLEVVDDRELQFELDARSIRGGHFGFDSSDAVSSHRGARFHYYRFSYIGFRVVVPHPSAESKLWGLPLTLDKDKCSNQSFQRGTR